MTINSNNDNDMPFKSSAHVETFISFEKVSVNVVCSSLTVVYVCYFSYRNMR